MLYEYTYIHTDVILAGPGCGLAQHAEVATDQDADRVVRCSERVHPVSVRRFPSFRTQPLENLSRYQ